MAGNCHRSRSRCVVYLERRVEYLERVAMSEPTPKEPLTTTTSAGVTTVTVAVVFVPPRVQEALKQIADLWTDKK